MTPPKKHNHFSVSNPKELEIYKLLEKESKIIILRKFSEIQGNTERQFDDLRKKMHEQNEKFIKGIEIIKKN